TVAPTTTASATSPRRPLMPRRPLPAAVSLPMRVLSVVAALGSSALRPLASRGSPGLLAQAGLYAGAGASSPDAGLEPHKALRVLRPAIHDPKPAPLRRGAPTVQWVWSLPRCTRGRKLRQALARLAHQRDGLREDRGHHGADLLRLLLRRALDVHPVD